MIGEIKRFTAYKVSIGLIGKGNIQLEQDKNDPTRERFRFLTLKDKDINRINLIANVIDKFQSDEKSYISLTVDDGTGQIRVKAFSDSINLIKDFQPGDTILVIGTLRYFNKELYILPEIVKLLDTKWLLARKLELEKEYGDLYATLEQASIQQEKLGQRNQQIQEQMQKQTHEQKSEQEQIENKNKSKFQTEPIIEREPIKEEKIGEKIIEEGIKEKSKEESKEKKEEEREEKKEEKKEKEVSEVSLREQILELIKKAEPEEGIDIDKIIMTLKDKTVEEINNSITSLLEEGAIYEPKPGRLRIL